MSNRDAANHFYSDIFKEYEKISNIHDYQKKIENDELTKKAMEDFDKFQDKVNSSPKLKEYFKNIQAALKNNSEYRAKSDPALAEAILLLSIED